MSAEPLAVHIAGRYAGEIDRIGNRLRLAYDADYAVSASAVPLSLSLPLDREVIVGAEVAGWLDGLLPGNERVRRRWAARHDARSPSSFDLLSTPIGLDCPGAVRTCPRSEAQHLASRPGGVDWLTEAEFGELVVEIVRDQAWERSGGRGAYSLAGAQAKTALCRRGDRWGEPWGTTASTHILKPSMRDLADQAINEHLCLAAARHCGLVAARTEALRVGPYSVVAVERYDRVATSGGAVARVHQEDLHQACGKPDQPIYQDEHGGGHSVARLAGLLADHSIDRDADRARFFDALAFNWIVCNTDAHAKNYSLLIGPRGVARLAPLYDIWSYMPYDPDYIRSHTMAMSALSDRRILAAENPDAWRAAARAAGLDADDGPERAARLARLIPPAFVRAVDELPARLRTSPIVADLTGQMSARGTHCLTALAARHPEHTVPF